MRSFTRHLARLGAVCLLALTCTKAAEPWPPGFFHLEMIVNPDRSYYPDFSDTEFLSLTPNPLLYPYVLSRWPSGPLTADAYFNLDRPVYALDQDVALQCELLSSARQVVLRSTTLALLCRARSPLAIAAVKKRLALENDAHVRADLLRALRVLGVRELAGMADLLAAANDRVRYEAFRFYCDWPAADTALLLAAAGREALPATRATIRNAIAERRPPAAAEACLALLKSDDVANIGVGLRALLQLSDAAAHEQLLLDLCRRPETPIRRAAAAGLAPGTAPALAKSVLSLLVADANASVRYAVAETIGRLAAADLQPLLLKLADDPGDAVRRVAAYQLRRYPNAASFAKLLEQTGDRTSPLTREAARQSLVAIAADYPVEEEISRGLASPVVDVRYNSCLVLAALGSKRYAAEAEKFLTSETRDLNLAAAVSLLATAGARPAGPAILAHSEHESPLVRANVAEAIGRLDLTAGYDVLKRYSLDDLEPEVRTKAEIAMAEIADEGFADTLRTILTRTNYASMSNPEFLLSADRAAACWAISRLPGLDAKLRKQLRRQIAVAVIKTPAGPTYDEDVVRISACWALATHAKRRQEAEVLATTNEMIRLLSKRLASAQGGATGPPANDALFCYAYQCAQFLAGEPIEQHRVKPRVFRFEYRKLPPPVETEEHATAIDGEAPVEPAP